MTNNYDKQNIATMEMIYGQGYLSAGGDEAVAAIVDGLDLTDLDVLDVGCGLGGAVITLARDHHVNHVHGIDIDNAVLERASGLVEAANLNEKITLTQVEPGPFPLADEKFDVVYLTAVACHFQDVKPLFDEICRVLKPGGKIVGRDWLKIDQNREYQIWDEMLRSQGLNFYFIDDTSFSNSLICSGFSDVSVNDCTKEIALHAVDAVERVENELKTPLTEVLGDDGYKSCLHWTRIRADALTKGGIGQSYFRGTRPRNL